MEILSNVHCIEGVNAHSYLLNGDHITLIDTGMPGNKGKILDYVKNVLNRKPEDIETIVITHHHLDHTGSLSELKKATNAQIAVYKEEGDYISGKKPSPDPFYLNIAKKFMLLFTKYSNVNPDICLNEENIVDGYTVIHTPGHTPGGMSLYNPDNGVVFVGDILRFNGEKVQGPPSMLIRDHQAFKNSIEKIANIDSEVMLPGHGKLLTKNASKLIKDYFNTL
jgi:hydroxyacylglutathione hydrolase